MCQKLFKVSIANTFKYQWNSCINNVCCFQFELTVLQSFEPTKRKKLAQTIEELSQQKERSCLTGETLCLDCGRTFHREVDSSAYFVKEHDLIMRDEPFKFSTRKGNIFFFNFYLSGCSVKSLFHCSDLL